MFSQDRDSMRRYFLDAWRKARSGEPLEPLEHQIADVIRNHPEYHELMGSPDTALVREYLPENGETNPFLHMSLHIAILEQVGTDRPAGIRDLYQRLVKSAGDNHAAEHKIMECLAQGVWETQRSKQPFVEQYYVECIRRIAGKRRERP
jgi:hypothetical protein